MRRVWLIRAGENAEEIDRMRDLGMIGVRYERIGDARQATVEQIDQGLIDAGRTNQILTLRETLLRFANEMRPGDLVVSPNPARREIWYGIVSGDYHYDDSPAIARYEHTRGVEWLGWLDRDASWMKDQHKKIELPPLMYELSDREWWWRQAESREFTTVPRLRSVRPATSSSGSPRVRKAATPKVPVRKPPVPLVRCAGSCGFQWAPTSLVGGLCNDCRADL